MLTPAERELMMTVAKIENSTYEKLKEVCLDIKVIGFAVLCLLVVQTVVLLFIWKGVE